VTVRDCPWGWSKDFDTLRQAVAFAVKRAARFRDGFEVHRMDWKGRTVRLASVYGVGPDTVAFVPHADPA
jgi:hypothetical protein